MLNLGPDLHQSQSPIECSSSEGLPVSNNLMNIHLHSTISEWSNPLKALYVFVLKKWKHTSCIQARIRPNQSRFLNG